MRALRILAAALAACLLAAPAATAAPCPAQHWVAAWLASPTDATTPGFARQTLRMMVTPHLGGSRVRVHLSNRFGTQPVTFRAVTVAKRAAGPAIVPGTSARLTFGGRARVTVPAGGDVVSDPADIAFTAFEDLAVSIYAGRTGPATEHFIGRQTSYLTRPGAGDRTASVRGTPFRETTTARFFVSGLDVLAPAGVGAVVAFGDSITDGYEGSGSPLIRNLEGLDAHGAYPDALQRRAGGEVAILDAGITGNRLLSDGLIPQHGVRGVDRFALDALGQAGVRTVIVLEGINDIGDRSADAPAIAGGLADLVAQAHAAGVRVLLGTLPPTGGARPASYGDEEAEFKRQGVNAWIRSPGAADGVVDFDAALRDPDDPARLDPRYDSGDHLHPNLAGYRAMADAVDLAELTAPLPRTVTVRVPRRYRGRLRRAVVRAHGRRLGTIRRPRGAVRVTVTEPLTVRLRIRLRGGRTVTRTQILLPSAGPCA